MKQKVVPLSDQVKEIILGSLLGDGSLKKNTGYRNARFSFRHSVAQAAYFKWKISLLKDISAGNSVFKQPADGFSSNKKLRYQSRSLESLTELHQLISKRGSFNISRRWLNKMSALSLAIWWFDDGSLITNSRRGVFCTDGFSKESVQILARYLKVVWNISAVVAPVGRKRAGTQVKYWRLWIRSSEELKKLLRLVLPYAGKAQMLPKVLLLYKDSKLQQRWISEVAKSTGLPKQEIVEAVAVKKQKWKHFRE
jgi:hypothetical protein